MICTPPWSIKFYGAPHPPPHTGPVDRCVCGHPNRAHKRGRKCNATEFDGLYQYLSRSSWPCDCEKFRQWGA